MGIRIPQSNVSSSAADEAITKKMHDELGRATTIASSLGAEQASGNITKTQIKAPPYGPSSPRTSSEGGLGCHFTMGDNHDSGFELTGFSDADYAGCKDTFKSTSGGAQFLAISYNPVKQLRTKHIAVRYHFIKEHVEKGTIELYFVKTDYQLADLFTKALPVDQFNYLVCRLSMRSLSPQELDRLAKSQ
nr:retrovirus-related Pol polyprotein from transposon TNT 1-94 [Tanacetum cinerariifolium]